MKILIALACLTVIGGGVYFAVKEYRAPAVAQEDGGDVIESYCRSVKHPYSESDLKICKGMLP